MVECIKNIQKHLHNCLYLLKQTSFLIDHYKILLKGSTNYLPKFNFLTLHDNIFKAWMEIYIQVGVRDLRTLIVGEGDISIGDI
jgi:hypothetical protein